MGKDTWTRIRRLLSRAIRFGRTERDLAEVKPTRLAHWARIPSPCPELAKSQKHGRCWPIDRAPAPKPNRVEGPVVPATIHGLVEDAIPEAGWR